MLRGQKYTFDQSDSTNQNHPFRLSLTNNGTHYYTHGTQYSNGWTYAGTPGINGIATFVIPYIAPKTLY